MTSPRIDIDDKLSRIEAFLRSRPGKLPAPFPGAVLFFSVSDGNARARVVGASGGSIEEAWQKGLPELRSVMEERRLQGRWLRVDWVEHVEATTWRELRARLTQTKRNYFREGLALDRELAVAFTEQEINANAMLYGGNAIGHAIVNENNFTVYARTKYPGLPGLRFQDDDEVFTFSTCGVFCDGEGALVELNGAGLDTGRRHIQRLGADDVLPLIADSSGYLARQVTEDGSFVYGYHPCFDRPIGAYNALRHASTTYSMTEAWEVTRDPALKAAIDRALSYLTGTLIRPASLPGGEEAAFLVDVGDEIKLGGNAVAILALTKYCTVAGTDAYLPLAGKLANGIRFMQDQKDGSFAHVLNYPDLSVKERFRTIYYEGEAAFGLMRLYEITRNPELIETVEKAFGHFIASDHWQYHDHWLSYCVNELTRYRPEERYYRFGIRNFASYLDFVLERITTFPTLLELMMAAEGMITRIQARPEYRHLLGEINLDKFYRALHVRAHYLLNGHFWPEMAMYYRKPDKIVGSFFIRHHAFRVRIDDVEHYLSGFIAYRKFLLRGGAPAAADEGTASEAQPPRAPDPVSFGFLMYPPGPKGFPEVEGLAAALAKKGLKVFYASYRNAQAVDGKLNGFSFRNGRWKRARFDIPAVIWNAPPRTSAETAVFDHLSSVTFLACHDLGGKQRTSSLLEADPAARGWLIPSSTVSEENVAAAFHRDERAIVKPYRSNRGRGVHLLQRVGEGTVSVRANGSDTRLDADEFRSFLSQRSDGNWMLQKYVASTDAAGRAFDIRVPLFRSEEGAWRAARIYARLGADSITSNLATGGSSHDALPFLSELYDEATATALIETLKGAALQMAETLQGHYPFLIDALGCDFGIADGQVYLFEVNSYPGMKGCLDSAIDLKAGYYADLSRSWRKAGAVVLTNSLEALGLPDLRRPFAEEGRANAAEAPVMIQAATEANRALLQEVMARGENDFSTSRFLRPGIGNPAYALIGGEARRRGYKSRIVKDTHLEIRDEHGVIAVFSPNSPNLSFAMRKVTENKELTRKVLAQAGLPVPVGRTFQHYELAAKYFGTRLGPQVVKPLRGSGGVGVTTRVTTEEQFRKAWERAAGGKRRVVVEDFAEGDELRIIVAGGETVAAVCRVPAYVVGDGVSTVAQLVERKNERRKLNPLMRNYPISQFDYLENELGKNLNFVPAADEFVRLASVSNVGLGGEAVSLIDVMHPSFRDLARKVFDAVPGATQLGLDILVKDFGAPADAANVCIVEINSDPAIGTPRFAAYGTPAIGIEARLLDFVEKTARGRRVPGEAGSVQPRLASAAVYSAACGGETFPRSYRLQARLLRDAARQRGLNIDELSADITSISRNGTSRLFCFGIPDTTLLASRRASNDKEMTKTLLRREGIIVPEGQAFAQDQLEQAWRFAQESGLPVVIKPLVGSGGKGVFTDISSLDEFRLAWEVALNAGATRIIVERHVGGRDYRLFVIGERLVAVAHREPAHVVGDGVSTIEALIARKNSQRQANPYHGAKPLALTPLMQSNLARLGLGEASVLADGEHLQLHTVANIGSGGESYDVTDDVHPEWSGIAVEARRAIFDAYHAGIDLIAEDISRSPRGQQWCVVEVNTNPDFGVNHFPMHGQGRDVAGALLESLF